MVLGSIKYQAKFSSIQPKVFNPCYVEPEFKFSSHVIVPSTVIFANMPSGRVSASMENRCLIQFSFVILSRKHSLKLVTKFRQCSCTSAERQDEFQINIKTFLWLKHLPVSLMSLNLPHCTFRCNFFILPTFYVLICI